MTNVVSCPNLSRNQDVHCILAFSCHILTYSCLFDMIGTLTRVNTTKYLGTY